MTAAIDSLLLAQLPRLRRYALRLTRSASTADDLVQETALKVLRAAGSFTPGTNFTAWSFRIMRNTHLDEMRKTRVFTRDIADVSEAHLSQVPGQDNVVFLKETIHIVESLPRREREALVSTCYEGRNIRESARRMECSVEAIKSSVFRARKRLQKLLECA